MVFTCFAVTDDCVFCWLYACGIVKLNGGRGPESEAVVNAKSLNSNPSWRTFNPSFEVSTSNAIEKGLSEIPLRRFGRKLGKKPCLCLGRDSESVW